MYGNPLGGRASMHENPFAVLSGYVAMISFSL
jgi:hypothetical protein